eukprot:6056205-Pyramimonas_sp.AAC.1
MSAEGDEDSEAWAPMEVQFCIGILQALQCLRRLGRIPYPNPPPSSKDPEGQTASTARSSLQAGTRVGGA